MRKCCHPLKNVLLVVVALVSIHTAVRSALTVTPWEQSAQLGTDATFVCTDDDNTTKAMFLTWSFPADSKSTPINSTDRARNVNGTLTIANLTYQDAGVYRCHDKNGNGSEPATGVLIVYVMPDYLKEGLIIAGISLGLLIIVLIGIGITVAGQRKVKKSRLLEHEKRLLKRKNSEHK